MKIERKREYYRLFEKGFLGNKARTWTSVSEAINSGCSLFSIRTKKGMTRQKVKYYIHSSMMKKELNEFLADGFKEEEVYFNEAMPDDKLLIQGEVVLTENGICLNYTTRKLPMYEALKDSQHVFGLSALNMLKQNLNERSYEDLMDLFELFPGSVIEFSCYSINLGIFRGRNTVIWEVRDY